MPTNLTVSSTIRNQTAWEDLAKQLSDSGPVGIMEAVDGTYTIFARVVGYVEDPTYGKLLHIQRIDAGGSLSSSAPADSQLPS